MSAQDDGMGERNAALTRTIKSVIHHCKAIARSDRTYKHVTDKERAAYHELTKKNNHVIEEQEKYKQRHANKGTMIVGLHEYDYSRWAKLRSALKGGLDRCDKNLSALFDEGSKIFKKSKKRVEKFNRVNERETDSLWEHIASLERIAEGEGIELHLSDLEPDARLGEESEAESEDESRIRKGT